MILLVEDNESIYKGLKYSLEEKDFNVVVADSVKSFKNKFNNKIDIVILDVSLPDGNGFDLYKDFIKAKNIPTIFLTARDSEEDIVKGLDLGADDYLTKPFSTKELIARINRILSKNKKNNIISVKNITFDMDKMELYKDNIKVSLSNLEMSILYYLISNINRVVTREMILEKIWELTGNDVDDHTVTVYIKRIKDKVGDDLITTIKKVGYRIDGE